MNPQIDIVLLGASAEREAQVRNELGRQGVLRAVPLGPATDCGDARVAIVDLEGDVDSRIACVERLAMHGSPVPVLALASAKDPDLILRAMRAGAREFVVLDGSHELARVVERLLKQGAKDGVGRVITVFSAKGGSGATFIAANLAGMLAEAGQRCVLVDLDLELGDVQVTLDLSGRMPISEVLRNMHRMDGELLRSSLARHASGVHVLSQVDHLEEAEQVKAPLVAPLLRFLATHFDYVVLDGLQGFGDLALAALDASDRILLVLSQTVPSLKNAQRCLELFRAFRYDGDKVRLVVNRYQKSDPIDVEAMVDSLGSPALGLVGNNYGVVTTAINQGLLMSESAPRSRITVDLRNLAATLVGKPLPEKQRSGFRSLFSSKKTTPDEPRVSAREAKEPPHGPHRATEST